MIIFLSNWWDIIAFLVLGTFHVAGWLSIRTRLQANPDNTYEARNLGATTLSSANTAGLTAVSILIPASLLFIQLSSDKSPLPPIAIMNVFRASCWFIASLFSGLILAFLIPMRAHKYNVSRILHTGIPFGFQLVTLLIGMGRLLSGLYYATHH